MPPLATITLQPTAVASLVGYLLLIAAAAYAGGSSVAFLSLGHRRMQVLLSLTGGVMLGVGLLHLLPHAYLELSRQLDTTMAWVLAGFFFMFLLERAFHGHAHHSADGSHGCGHESKRALMNIIRALFYVAESCLRQGQLFVMQRRRPPLGLS